MEADVAPSPVVSFRPAKRQKFMRKRPESGDMSDTMAGEHTAATGPETSGHNSDSNDGASKVTRFQKPRRLRKGGIEFSTSRKQDLEQDSRLESALAENAEADQIKAKFDRFTARTGQKVDVDKHMMEYIESELAKRQNRDHENDQTSAAAHRADRPPDAQHSSSHAISRREPATLGKLHEIDLGQEATLQNIARTAAATRRMAGEPSSEQSQMGTNESGWRNRTRKYEDMERDRLVDEVLRESKLDVYDEPEQDISMDDQAADDRIADQFRRDFMEAIHSRRRTARARAATSAKNTTSSSKTAKPEAPRGPKLGGSRSARAAMREMQEKGKKPS